MLPGHRGVGQVRRKFDFLGQVDGSITHDPWGVRLGERNNEAERLFRITCDELLGANEIVGIGGIPDTGGIESGNVFEGED